MALSGKLVGQVEIKSDGDLFHELLRYKPHHISTMSPHKVHGCDLHDGELGAPGSVISWSYSHEGKKKIAKELIEAIDEENKTVRFKVIEGDLLEEYKAFTFIVAVDTKGANNLITWTFEYEKPNPNVPDPNSVMDFCLALTKDMETHALIN